MKPNKQLLGKAKENRKWLCKGADSHKQFIQTDQGQEQFNNQRSSELTTETNGLMRPYAIRDLTEKSTEWLKITIWQSQEWLQTFKQIQEQLQLLLTLNEV